MRLVTHTLNRAISDFATNMCSREGFCGVTTREGGFLESIKKSSHKATLWLCASADHSAGVSAFDLRRWRRLISPRADSTRKPAVLSPVILTCSINSRTSWGNLTETCKDLLLLLPVTMLIPPSYRWCSVCLKKMLLQVLWWCSPMVYWWCSPDAVGEQKMKPRSAPTLTGPLTTNAKQTSEAAMFHRNTPHTGRAALTLKKITWRFLVLGEHAPVIVHITASSEQEARAAMPPCCIAIFAARIMRGGSANA